VARRRGKRWTASGYDRGLKRKVHLGTFDTRREAAAAEAQHKLKARPLARETIASFAGRWLDDYPRPRRSSNTSNAERIKPLVAELGSVRLADMSRPMARAWALKHRWALPAARAMFADAMNDGLGRRQPVRRAAPPGQRGPQADRGVDGGRAAGARRSGAEGVAG
jgi:hypothetical protein